MEMSVRHLSVLIPYRMRGDGQLEVFMQQRDAQAPSFPNHIGFFGGGIEGRETPEVAVRREIREELCIELAEVMFIRRFEIPGFVRNVFALEVEIGFETRVRVMEGDGGIFLSEREIAGHTKIIPPDKEILLEVLPQLRNR